MSNLEVLQKNFGYNFKNLRLLKQSLSHRSIGTPNNERLEYLGDSILGFIVAEFLYHRFPNLFEGDLTKLRAILVRRNTLASMARSLSYPDLIILGSGELKSGGHDRDSILADAFEATIGAIYLDGGLECTRSVLEILYKDSLDTIQPVDLKDNKTLLQEALQKTSCPLPIYRMIDQFGEAHKLTFTVGCQVQGYDNEFIATGASRKIAEQNAASLAMDAFLGTVEE